jgi:hypothetical protein
MRSIWHRPGSRPIRMRKWGTHTKIRGTHTGFIVERLNPKFEQFEGGVGFEDPREHNWSEWIGPECSRIGFVWR